MRESYGGGDPIAAASFAKVLDRCTPDIVHLHAWTAGVSLRLLRLTRARRIPVVFTYHTATVSCTRGTLLRWGAEPCDGKLGTVPCAACMLQGRGLNRFLSQMLAKLGPLARLASRTSFSGRAWTAISASDLIATRLAAFQSLLEEADYVIAPSGWIGDLLLRNGISPQKLTVCRAGLSEVALKFRRAARSDSAGAIRIAFFGRASRL